MSVKDIIEEARELSSEEIDLIEKAYEYAKEAHEGQERYSGEPYFHHLEETAKNLAKLGMGGITIAAGLLHDTIEDAGKKTSEIKKEFGGEILFLIEGVTKLGKLKYRGLERHTESLRKLFMATAQDVRVIVIKLADRLHNMKTLEHVPSHKRKRIAQETLQIYAPIAHRLGIGKLKGDLEDLAFPYLHPFKYKEVLELKKKKNKENTQQLDKVAKKLKKELAAENITVVKTDYREKHLYSLYRKLLRKDMNIDKVYDVAALRVIVPTITDCYRTLGVIHGIWRPLPGRIKDYIASPKVNDYRSLHTSIFTGDGAVIEIQIRTPKMHRQAEFGIAAHVAYKEGDSQGTNSHFEWLGTLLKPFKDREDTPENKNVERERAQKDVPDWLSELVEIQKGVSNPKEFIENLESDFFEDRVFVFTPKGDVIDLPKGATAIDFAYALHTEIGNRMSGAKINGKLTSLESKLSSGDIVDVETKKNGKPTAKWLEHAQTTLARRKIRSALKK